MIDYNTGWWKALCMFVCHDERWHIRNPTQCQVVEGIIHVCLYVMIKSGTIDIQHSAGWWRASFMYVCLSLIKSGTIDIQHSAGWWRASFMGIIHVCLYVMIKSGTIDIQHSAGWWRASFMYVCLSLIKSGTIDIQHGAGWWRASFMYVHDKRWHNRYLTECRVVEGIIHVCLFVIDKKWHNRYPTRCWRASCMHLRMMYVTDNNGIEIILHVKQINSYLVAPMYL